MDLSNLFFVALVALLAMVAAVIDVRTRRLPNWLTVSAMAAAVVFHLVMRGLAGLEFALLGFATGFGMLLILWLIGGAGGGDVKLMGALGAWLGVGLTWRVFLVSTIMAAVGTAVLLAAGLLSRGLVAAQRRRLASPSTGRPNSRGTAARGARRASGQGCRLMPYAVPVALGTWLVLALAWQTGSLPW
jgi:prepilin peptidase CpaA